ncbi:MAG TPA: DUF4252 domain-containing protein [Steroidobacteraceae bacterium]|nr:DUF4252 domain-containing protein [Steroidobacteraceae bacterium]
MNKLTVVLGFALWSLSNTLGNPLRAEPRLTIPEFEGLAAKANESVNITLDGALLNMAAQFLSADNADEAAAKEVLNGIIGIYIKSFSFDEPRAYAKSDIDAVRKQLAAPGWSRLVEVRSRKEESDVDIYISQIDGKANGLAIISSEPKEFTIVNIVGSVDLQKLRKLEGKMGVPKLELAAVDKKK